MDKKSTIVVDIRPTAAEPYDADRSLGLSEADESIDLRSFGDMASSQASSTYAINKTLKSALKYKSSSSPKKGIAARDADATVDASSRRLTKTWEAFSFMSIIPDNFETTAQAMGLPVKLLERAMMEIVPTISPHRIQQAIEKFDLGQDDALSWPEFRDVCNYVLDEASPTRHGSICSHNVYKSLMKKQRIAALNFQSDYYSPSQMFPVDDMKSKVTKDALVKVVRDETRRNKFRLDVRRTSSAGSETLSQASLPLPNYHKNLQKTKVYGMTAREAVPLAKWAQAQKLREEKTRRLKALEDRKQMLSTISTIVSSQDRMAVNSALNAREDAIQETIDQQYAIQRHRDRVIDYNIKLQKRQAIEAKRLAARQLKHTIRMTTSFTEASLRNELSMKQSSVLESRSHAVLSPCTSFKIIIPDEITHQLKSAKTLRKYREAKNEEQKYLDAMHAQRLRDFAASRQEAKSRADARVDCRIAVAPFHVDDYFSADRDDDQLILADDLEAFQRGQRSTELDERSRMTDTTQGLSFGLQETSWRTNSMFKSSAERSKR